MSTDTINKLRSKIDKLDNQIFSLILKRLKHAEKIGEIKKKSELPIDDKNREDQIISRILKRLDNDLDRNQIKQILEQIIIISKDFQIRKK